jgi:hypothetical protein
VTLAPEQPAQLFTNPDVALAIATTVRVRQ